MAGKTSKKITIKPSAQVVQEKSKQLGRAGRLLPCLLLAVVSFALYANTLQNGFALDDVMVLKENTIVTQGTKGIPELLATPHMHGYSFFPDDTYRPLPLVMLALGYQYFGMNAGPFHLLNILLYAACVIMLFLFIDWLFERKKTSVAFVASLIFALHPVHTEVVANIKSCDELLCFFFGFLSLNLFISYMKGDKMLQLLAGAISLFLAYLSKETVVGLLPVIVLLFFFYLNEDRKRAAFITAVSIAATVIFVAIRTHVLNEYNANQTSNSIEMLAIAPSIAVKIATEITIMGRYLLLLFVPYPLLCTYGGNTLQYASFANIGTWASLLAYGGLFWVAVTRFMKDKRDPWAFGIFFYLSTIFLFSNIVFLIAGTMGDRLLFFASVGFCIIGALGIEKLVGGATESIFGAIRNPKALAVFVPVALLFGGMTFARNKDWADNYTLYKADIVKAPNSAMLNYYLGLELETTVAGANEQDTVALRKIRNEGLMYLTKSVGLSHDFADAHATLGNTYIMLSQYDSAEVHEKRALSLAPGNEKTINNLAYIYYRERKFSESLELSRKAIAINPRYATPHTNMARCYFELGKSDSAVLALHNGIAADAANVAPYQLLALYYNSVGMQDSASKYSALQLKYRN
jgi:tetratricopeptide (TPR) repeat protein